MALRSSSMIGGASVLNIVVGLLRMKAAAVLLQDMLGTAFGITGLGVGNVQITPDHCCERGRWE